jgi:predicted nucleic acid-binding protein
VDLYEDRRGYNDEPIGDFAFNLFVSIRSSKNKIVISVLTIKELEMNYSLEEINGMMKPFDGIIEKVGMTKAQRDEAIIISKHRNVPKGDALHAIIARDNNFTLVSRDRHFKKLKDICDCYKPEDII